MTLTYMGLAADPQLPANVRRPEIWICAVLINNSPLNLRITQGRKDPVKVAGQAATT
ncbi:hypothetical protein SDC9_26505 [bioreactor metagenome]|jgi:hypothetical protein|uniref:Uncharacterized protein n=1 Tax=bioreactor metagenome TaxID=1076179 RepID=A0A644UNU7_9ZZZZ